MKPLLAFLFTVYLLSPVSLKCQFTQYGFGEYLWGTSIDTVERNFDLQFLEETKGLSEYIVGIDSVFGIRTIRVSFTIYEKQLIGVGVLFHGRERFNKFLSAATDVYGKPFQKDTSIEYFRWGGFPPEDFTYGSLSFIAATDTGLFHMASSLHWSFLLNQDVQRNQQTLQDANGVGGGGTTFLLALLFAIVAIAVGTITLSLLVGGIAKLLTVPMILWVGYNPRTNGPERAYMVTVLNILTVTYSIFLFSGWSALVAYYTLAALGLPETTWAFLYYILGTATCVAPIILITKDENSRDMVAFTFKVVPCLFYIVCVLWPSAIYYTHWWWLKYVAFI